MFGNHSFKQEANARPSTWTEQVNWGYDPRQYLEKPLMKINHVTFDGTLRSCSFEEFRATFAVVCGGRNMPESQKLICLKQLLAGDPLKIFSNIVGHDLNPGSLERVMRTLEDHYGGSQRIVNTYISRLTSYSPIRKFDCSSLLDLLTIVEEIFNRYEAHNPGFLERDEVLVAHIRRVMPNDERLHYYSKLAGHGRNDTFLTVRDYLKSRYESFRLAAIADVGLSLKQSSHNIQEEQFVERSSGYPGRDEEEEQEIAWASQGADASTKAGVKPLAGSQGGVGSSNSATPDSRTARPSGATKSPPVCSFCSKAHYVWWCPDFQQTEVKNRYTHVREKRLCFHCLLPGHSVKTCTFRPEAVCGVQGCKRKHHRLVHNFQELGLCSIEIFLEQGEDHESQDVPVEVQRSFVNLTLTADNQPVLPLEEQDIAIRTVTLEVRCGDKKKRVLAALDSCSNNTNIDADLAEELGLPIVRRDIQREMSFLERKAHLTSNFVKFVLAPLGSDTAFEMTGFTVKNLMAGTPVVDWNRASEAYPYLKAAEIPKLRPSDRVQILIGTEFADLMTPNRVLRGPPGAPVAELTDLGWAFSGRTNQTRTLHASCQVDYSFMALWHFKPSPSTRGGCMAEPPTVQNELPSTDEVNLTTSEQDLPLAWAVSRTEQSLDTGIGESTNQASVEVPEESGPVDQSNLDGPTPLTSSPVSGAASGERFELKDESLEHYLEVLQASPLQGGITLCQMDCDRKLNDLQRHWELEAVGLIEKAPRISRVKDPSPRGWSAAEVELDDKMKVVYLEEKGQFQMSIPWKLSRPQFQNNRFAVKKRQESTLKHLGPRVEEVSRIFEGYLAKAYMCQLVHRESQEWDCRYLPFFCVVDETKDTTPVRIVWDCRAVYDGKSLNSEVELTPNWLQDFFKVLLRMRKYQFTVTSDVSEMFLKILMDPKDRRFLFDDADYEWRKRVTRVFPSDNGLIRKVEVTNGRGKFYVRPITRIIPIVL